MTVPHLMNCPHTDSGWCTECVAELGNENWRQRDDISALRKDAERYRWLRLNPDWLGWTHDHQAEHVDNEVDKAMLAG